MRVLHTKAVSKWFIAVDPCLVLELDKSQFQHLLSVVFKLIVYHCMTLPSKRHKDPTFCKYQMCACKPNTIHESA